MLQRWTTTSAIGFVLLFDGSALTRAAEIKVISSDAIKSVIEEVSPQFQKTSAHKLNIQWGTAVPLKAEIERGASFDLAVLTVGAIDDLIKQGKLIGGSRAEIAKSGIGVAARNGTPKPDIATTEALKRALRNARSVGVVEQGTTWIYLRDLLQRLGIAEAMRPKLKMIQTDVAAAVERGEVDLGITQISEILPYRGVELVGPFPRDIQLITAYAAAVSSKAKEPEAARAFIRILTASSAASLFKAKGLDPAGPAR
jgi:molybdate transport system substrate-binding protein